MNIFKRLWLAVQVSDNDVFLQAIAKRDVQIDEQNIQISKLVVEIELKSKALNELYTDNEELEFVVDALKNANDSELDKYCKKHFLEIDKIVYKQKRRITGKTYTISLHELITPESWSVAQLMKGITEESYLTQYNFFKAVGDKVAKKLTWDDDKNLDTSGDYYLYPNETLAREKADCEDHAFVVASCHKELGGAWGFLGKDGHAFNCFMQDNKLYVLDTVGTTAVVKEYVSDCGYDIEYIITKDHAYQVGDGTIRFGEIAGW